MRSNKPKLYALRTCHADMTSYAGFVWPKRGPVSAPDWNSAPRCGGGLHGLKNGTGDPTSLNWSLYAKWLAVEVTGEVVDLAGQIKFSAGIVRACGDRKKATDWLVAHGCDPAQMVGAFVTVGDGGTATAGHRGTATTGDRGTATAGYGGTATTGHHGTATAGYGGTATAGHEGILQIAWWDGSRCRLAVAYVGEAGIEANKPYKFDGEKWIPQEFDNAC